MEKSYIQGYKPMEYCIGQICILERSYSLSPADATENHRMELCVNIVVCISSSLRTSDICHKVRKPKVWKPISDRNSNRFNFIVSNNRPQSGLINTSIDIVAFDRDGYNTMSMFGSKVESFHMNHLHVLPN